MNYFNPYYMVPMGMIKPSLFGTLRNSLRSININGILNGTQRTLNIINQAIPLVKQVSPVMKNAKTMFKVMNEFKKIELPNKKTTISKNNYKENTKIIKEEINEGPNFFV